MNNFENRYLKPSTINQPNVPIQKKFHNGIVKNTLNFDKKKFSYR